MIWVQPLLDWYHLNKRSMPWRSDPRPYPVWISEIMLQQTQVDTVIPYFNRFMLRFPTVYDLASADLDDVLKYWEGLGYYSRARNLYKAARLICEDYDGLLPASYQGLLKIPGIGPYCAAAIGSIAFGLPTPVVDGNVLRVFTRFWGDFTDIRDTKLRKFFFEKLTPFVVESMVIEGDSGPSSINQAMMELGATCCKSQSPTCTVCPISSFCVAFKTDQVDCLPVKSQKSPVPHYTICVGLIWKDGRLLIGKRKETKMLGGLWEFPGGKCLDSESHFEAVKREVLEETGVVVFVGEHVVSVDHAYTHFKITLHAYHCEIVSGEPEPLSATVLKWVGVSELEDFAFPTANKKIIERLI